MTAATPATSTYRGADVDGLDHLAQEFQQAAQVCDEVKAACEIIVAASFIFGPFGAAFVSYLKTVVIPWLTKISEALKLMAKVLSAHSNAQRDASSSATSLPSYSTPPSLPSGNTGNYPVLPPSTGSGAGSGGAGATTPAPVGGSASPGTGSSVTSPPSIGGTTPAPATPNTPSTPAVPSSPIPATPGTAGGAGGLGSIGSLPPGVTATPLHPGDAVGYLTVPVEIGKDGTITPLLHTTAPATPTTPAVPQPTPVHHTAPGHAVPHHPTHVGHHAGTTESGALGSGGGSAGGGSLGGGGGLASGSGAHALNPQGADAQFVSSTPATIGAHPATAAAAAHGTGHAGGASHDGLYGGIGQATGIGAGAAALARATLHEARQRAENGLLGAVTLPFDADADTAVRATVLNGELQ